MDAADAELRLPVAQVPLLQMQSLLGMGERRGASASALCALWTLNSAMLCYVLRAGGRAGGRAGLLARERSQHACSVARKLSKGL